jgi:hypothetical protein
MKKIFGFVFFLCLTFGLFAQDKKKEKSPDEQIIVKKEFDERGNMTRFDSTYIHKWSSDSVFKFGFPKNDFFSSREFGDLNNFMRKFFNDSVFSFPRPFFNDSTHVFNRWYFNNPPDFGFDRPPVFPDDLNDFQEFENPEQQKEWNALLEKQHKERMEFQRKWSSKKREKIY